MSVKRTFLFSLLQVHIAHIGVHVPSVVSAPSWYTRLLLRTVLVYQVVTAHRRSSNFRHAEAALNDPNYLCLNT
jgi:hypothetical protein